MQLPNHAAISQWFRQQKSKVDATRFPNFMVLGPQSTGTTWVYKNLDAHPEIYIVPRKETFFFCEDSLVRELSAGGSPDIEAYMRVFRRSAAESVRRSLKAFLRFGEAYRPLAFGEATASYAWQPEVVVEGICSLNPDLRGIIMVRNPIEKIWSNMRRKVVRERGYRSADAVPEEEIKEFIHDPVQIERSRFSHMIEAWAKHLKPGNLYLGRFDDIAADPRKLLLEMFEFLGVRSEDRFVTDLARKKIRVGSARALSPKWQVELERIFADELEVLRDRYGFDWSGHRADAA